MPSVKRHVPVQIFHTSLCCDFQWSLFFPEFGPHDTLSISAFLASPDVLLCGNRRCHTHALELGLEPIVYADRGIHRTVTVGTDCLQFGGKQPC